MSLRVCIRLFLEYVLCLYHSKKKTVRTAQKKKMMLTYTAVFDVGCRLYSRIAAAAIALNTLPSNWAHSSRKHHSVTNESAFLDQDMFEKQARTVHTNKYDIFEKVLYHRLPCFRRPEAMLNIQAHKRVLSWHSWLLRHCTHMLGWLSKNILSKHIKLKQAWYPMNFWAEEFLVSKARQIVSKQMKVVRDLSSRNMIRIL